MPLSTEQIPNRALNGEELKAILIEEFRRMLNNNYIFLPTVAYRRASFSITATLHLGKPHEPQEIKSRVNASGLIEGEPPMRLECACGHTFEEHKDGGDCTLCVMCREYREEETSLTAIKRDVTLDNPNLARVHHDLPIRLQERKPLKPIADANPLPGEPPAYESPFPEIVNKELRYDRTQFPPEAAPVDTNVSEKRAAELGFTPRGKGKGVKVAKMTQSEIDEIDGAS